MQTEHRYYLIANLIFKSDVPLEVIAEREAEGSFDVEICRNDFEIPEDSEEVAKLSRLGLNPLVATADDVFYIDWKSNGGFRISGGRKIEYNSLAISSVHFEHFLVNEVIAAIFFQRGYFLLHGSAARLPNGKAAVFFGEPGAGKSTTLGFFVKNECRILTDEVVVIGFSDDDKPYVMPFLPILRLLKRSAKELGFTDDKTKYKYEITLEGDFDAEPMPLHHIFYLKKVDQEEFEINGEKNAEAHLALIANFSLPEQFLDPSASIRRFSDASRILNACDFFDIKRNDKSFKSMSTFVSKFIRSTTN